MHFASTPSLPKTAVTSNENTSLDVQRKYQLWYHESPRNYSCDWIKVLKYIAREVLGYTVRCSFVVVAIAAAVLTPIVFHFTVFDSSAGLKVRL